MAHYFMNLLIIFTTDSVLCTVATHKALICCFCYFSQENLHISSMNEDQELGDDNSQLQDNAEVCF